MSMMRAGIGMPGMPGAASYSSPSFPGYAPMNTSSYDSGGSGGGGGMPSWLMPLMAGSTPTPRAVAGYHAPAPAPPPISRQQQMLQNTQMGNNLGMLTQTHALLNPGGAQVNGFGQITGTNGGLLQEGVPMAGHIGTARGPLTAYNPATGGGNGYGGGGGYGGAGGYGGGTGGGGGQNDVAAQLQRAQDKANAANQQRYNQLLTLTGQLSDSQMQRENQQRNYDLGRVDQNAISAGIGNTTILPNLEQGVEDQSAIRQQEIGDQGIRSAMGIVQGRTDQQPDYALIAQLAARPGANGQQFPYYNGPQAVGYGGGFNSGAGYGGGGAGGTSIFQTAANNYGGYGNVNAGTSSNNNGWGPGAAAANAASQAASEMMGAGTIGLSRIGSYNSGSGGTPVDYSRQDVGYGPGVMPPNMYSQMMGMGSL